MDYIERMIQRALAVPRQQAPPLVDPFERIAPWSLDAPPPQEQSAPVRRARAAADASVAAAVTPVAPSVPASPGPALARVVQDAPARAAIGGLPAAADAPAPTRSVEGARPQNIEPVSAAEALPTAHADAFMRSLGVKVLAAELPTPARIDAPADALVAAAPSRHLPARLHPAREAECTLQTIRPLPPRAPAPVAALASPRSPRAPSSPGIDAARPPAPHDAPPAARPIVQTTLVVAPTSRRLDDLAHSSGIARFGIGQG